MNAIIIAVLATLMGLIPLFFNPFFYFLDDYQSYFLGGFNEIGRILSTGEFPLLTSRTWFGGSFLFEYQYGLFNPVCLVFYFIFYKVQLPYEQAGAIFAIFHLVVLSLGCFFLSRKLKISLGGSYFVSLSILHSGFLMYWAASTWIVILVAYAWLPWAIFGFYGIKKKRSTFIGIFASYMTIASGNPHNSIILSLFVLGVILYFYWEKQYRNAVYVILSFIIVCCLVAPSIFPIASYLQYTNRGFGDPYSWKVNLESLLAIGMPTFRGVYKVWDGSYNHSSAPFSYVSWLASIIILGYWLNPQRKTNNIIKSMVFLTISFGIASMFPSPILLNIPFRFLLGFHLSALLLSILILSYEDDWQKIFTWRLIHIYSFCLLLLPILNFIGYPVNTFNNKIFSLLHLFAAISITSLLYILKIIYFPDENHTPFSIDRCFPKRFLSFCRSFRNKNYLLWGGCLSFSSLIFIGILTVSHQNNNVPDFHVRTDQMKINPFQLDKNDRVYYFLRNDDYWLNIHDKNFLTKVVGVGNLSLYQKHTSINGYSPIGFQPLANQLALSWLSLTNSPEFSIKNIFTVVEPYNKPLIELMGVNKLVSIGALKYLVDQYKTKGWILTENSDGVALYTNSKITKKNSIFGYLPEGVTIHDLKVRETSISFSYKTNEKYNGLPILLSRLGIPGYFYQENNQEPISPQMVSGFLPAIPLQKNTRTNLISLYYFPKSLQYGLYIFGLGFIFLIFFFCIRKKSNR